MIKFRDSFKRGGRVKTNFCALFVNAGLAHVGVENLFVDDEIKAHSAVKKSSIVSFKVLHVGQATKNFLKAFVQVDVVTSAFRVQIRKILIRRRIVKNYIKCVVKNFLELLL